MGNILIESNAHYVDVDIELAGYEQYDLCFCDDENNCLRITIPEDLLKKLKEEIVKGEFVCQ